MPTLDRQEEWPPTFTDTVTTLFLGRDEYDAMGKPAQVDVTITPIAAPEPEPEVVEPVAEVVEPEPLVAVGSDTTPNPEVPSGT